MSHILRIFLSIFFGFLTIHCYSGYSQSLISSNSHLAWMGSQNPKIISNSVLNFNVSTRELTSVVNIGLLQKNKAVRDSLEFVYGSLVMSIQWFLGTEPIESYSSKDNEKTLKLQAKVTIRDSVKFLQVPLIFNTLKDVSNGSYSGNGTTLIPAGVNFVVKIDPVVFGLNRKPYFWTKRFLVGVENGVINKK